MKNYLGRIVLLVDDYDDAAKFYSENFGFTPIFDTTTDVGQRFLHMGSEPLDSLGIWFLKAEGKKQKELVGKQTGEQPAMVIYTTDIDEQYNLLLKNKVTIKTSLVKTPEYKFLHCYDLYGNEIIVVELED
ncbi:VOC family protein [Aequorivita viscosa]|nr:VOC family protein [Aequorivita viscosa]